MGLSWKARYRHYHARAALDRLQSQRRPPSWESLTVAEMNEQFSFFIENHSDSRNHMINYVPKGDESARTNVGKTATTIRAVVSEEGWQTAESNRWSLKAVEEVSAKDFGPNLEIFVLRHADHAFASFVELIEQDEYSFEVYAGWYAANNWNWVPGEPILGSVFSRGALTPLPSPSFDSCAGNSFGANIIEACGRWLPLEDDSDDNPKITPQLDFECNRVLEDQDGRYPFMRSDLADLLTRPHGGLHWNVLQ